EVSKEAMRDLEKMRVGVRKGMLPWGRERMAEGEYERALRELNKPTPDRKAALWPLDAATHPNPKLMEAIKRKQELTGRETTTVANSTARSSVTRAILAERAATSAVPATQPVIPAQGPEHQPAAEPLQTAEAPTTQPVAAAPSAPAKWSDVWFF